ncbi:MAG: hypothetical protein K8T91_15615 [Planctomycetes bacterium]|nr:hypothetical protein [Planctomycetota bacterium]
MPRFQFTIGNLLWSTFWAAMSFAALGWLLYRNDRSSPGLMAVALAVLSVAPIQAIMSLFGRTRTGMVLAIVFAIVTILTLLTLAEALADPSF